MPPMEEIPTNQLIKTLPVTDLIRNNQIPSFYVNGVTIGYTGTEAHLIFNQHGRPQCIINLPFSLLKTLVGASEFAIKGFEEKTNIKVMSLEEIQDRFKPKQ